MDDHLEINHIHNVLKKLKNETSTVDFTDTMRAYERRKKVIGNLQSLLDQEDKNKDEYILYD